MELGNNHQWIKPLNEILLETFKWREQTTMPQTCGSVFPSDSECMSPDMPPVMKHCWWPKKLNRNLIKLFKAHFSLEEVWRMNAQSIETTSKQTNPKCWIFYRTFGFFTSQLPEKRKKIKAGGRRDNSRLRHFR